MPGNSAQYQWHRRETWFVLSENKVRRGFAPREYIVAVLSAYSHGIAKAVRTLTMHSGDARVWRPRGEFRQCGTERQTPNLSCSLVTVEGVEQSAVQNCLKRAPQTLQLECPHPKC
jgi:hypothetical protein